MFLPAALLLLACRSADPPAEPLGPEPQVRGPALGSGASLQDPSGFPQFHDWPAPPGPRIDRSGEWSAPVRLSDPPGGGYRPQIAVGPDGTLHAVFYTRLPAGDLIRHRRAPRQSAIDRSAWSAPLPAGFDRDRNWGPDIVARGDGSVAMVFDHMLPDMSSRGYLTIFRDGSWSPPEALTPDDRGEVGSGHVADGVADDLAYVWIGKALDPRARFQARGRWYREGRWSEVHPFTDGGADAWHTNVERRPDGSVLVGYDVGTGGEPTTLFVAEGRDGSFGEPENLSATGSPGERPHFAFGPGGTDHVTWFGKERGRPLRVMTRRGGPGRWGPVEEPSRGMGGFHFDPEIAVSPAGTLCLVWGWDAGSEAELVYSVDTGDGWTPPRRVATIGSGKPGLASLVADDRGDFHVVWNQGVRGSNEVYYARLASPPPG